MSQHPRIRALIRLDSDEPQAVQELLRAWSRGPESLLRLWSRADFSDILPSSNSDIDELVSGWIGTTPLHQAAGAAGLSARALSEALRILGHTSVDVRDSHGHTPLSRAVRADCAARVHALSQAGANTSAEYCVQAGSAQLTQRTHWSYLRFAASSGRVTALSALISQGADYVRSSQDGKRPLHIAIEKGRFASVQTLLTADLADIQAMPDIRRRQAFAFDRFLVKNSTPEYSEAANAVVPSDSSASDSDDQEDEDMTPPGTSAVSSDWDGGDREPSDINSGMVDQNDSDDEITFGNNPGGFAAVSPGTPQTSRQMSNPFDPSLTDANNSVGGADGLARILQQALSQSVSSPHDTDSVAVSMSMGANRDRGSSLYHLAASYGYSRILMYLLDHPVLRQVLPHHIRNEQGKVPAFMAARSGSIPCLSIFLDRGVDVNSVDLENWTILNEAVKYNRIEAVQYVLARGGSVSLADDDAWTPLHVAGRFGIKDAVPLLVQAGADINAITEDNESPLQLACSQTGHVEVMRALLAHGARDDVGSGLTPTKILVDRKDYVMLDAILAHFASDVRIPKPDLSPFTSEGDNFIFRCVSDSQPSVIRSLLALGIDGDVRDAGGDTPLCLAVRRKDSRVLDALLAGGVTVDFAQKSGSRALHLACDEGWATGCQILLHYRADIEAPVPRPALHVGFTPLMLAARRGHTDCLRELMRCGADLNAVKRDGYTAAHLAALNGQVETLEALLKAGASTDLREENSFTALHVAVRNNQLEVTRTLLSHGVDVDIRGPSGLTALHFAAYMTNARMLWLLLTVGADVNARDADMSSALHVASGRERGRVAVQMLLTSSADAGARDKQGDTPLHTAAYRGLYATARVLLRRGAPADVANEIGLTPLHLASAHGSANTVRTLLAAGADPRARAQGGETPYALATNADRKEARTLLWSAAGESLEKVAPAQPYNVESPAASPAASMDIVQDGSEGRTICIICQNPLRFGESVRQLPCGHIYHVACIDRWFGGEALEDHDNCPLCQKTILPDALPER